VFDEFHVMAQEGVARVLLMLKCPFVCLSATIGNPKTIVKQLNDLQKAKGPDQSEVILCPSDGLSVCMYVQ